MILFYHFSNSFETQPTPDDILKSSDNSKIFFFFISYFPNVPIPDIRQFSF